MLQNDRSKQREAQKIFVNVDEVVAVGIDREAMDAKKYMEQFKDDINYIGNYKPGKRIKIKGEIQS